MRVFWSLAILSSVLAVFCAQPSYAKNLYPDNEHTRRELTDEEKRHLIRFGGCSGMALSPDLILTAHHCLNYNTGYYEYDPRHTFTRLKTVEYSKYMSNDYAIVQIKWDAGQMPADLRFSPEIAHLKSSLVYGKDELATPLFTLGYPIDKAQRATYSSGFLKSEKHYKPSKKSKTKDSYFIQMNVPTINGNSGGGVFTENYKLVGVVSAGNGFVLEKNMLEPDYNSQNPKYWNLAGAIYYIYQTSRILKKLYPEGKSPNITPDGVWIGPSAK